MIAIDSLGKKCFLRLTEIIFKQINLNHHSSWEHAATIGSK